MKCSSCQMLAVVAYEDDRGRKFALCVECELKFQAARTMEYIRLAHAAQEARADLDDVMGMPRSPRVPLPSMPRVSLSPKPVVMNHVHIAGDQLGVLNLGSVQQIDNAVTVIRNAGEHDLASQIAELTSAIGNSQHLAAVERRKVIETLSFVAAELTVPQKDRRGAAILAMAADFATILTPAVDIAARWDKLWPMLVAAFGA